MSHPVHIDCASCPVRDVQCGDCMVTALLELAPPALRLDDLEQQAVEVLFNSGLISQEVAVSARAQREPLRQLRVTG